MFKINKLRLLWVFTLLRGDPALLPRLVSISWAPEILFQPPKELTEAQDIMLMEHFLSLFIFHYLLLVMVNLLSYLQINYLIQIVQI